MPSTSIAHVRAVIEERIAAIGRKDAAAAMSVLAHDVVAFELGPPLAQSVAATRDVEAFAQWLAGFEEVSVEVRDMKVEADETIGFAHALHHLVGVRRDGREVSLWLRSTLCLRCESGAWRIAHAHSSVPMMMDGSFRAAVDLQP